MSQEQQVEVVEALPMLAEVERHYRQPPALPEG